MKQYVQDIDEDKDYKFDLSRNLEDGESVAEYVITADEGLTVYGASISGGTGVVYWVKGGEAGREYKVECLMTTSNLRKWKAVAIFRIIDR